MFRAHRVVLIGATGVGKTSILHRYLHGQPPSETASTVGALFYSYSRKIDGETIAVQFWDTAGQERYRSLGPIYYRMAQGAIAVFDLAHPESRTDLEAWIDAFREHSGGAFVVIAANKCDSARASESADEVQSWAAAMDAQSIRTSAVSGAGVADLFDAVLSHLAKAGRRQVKAEEVGLGGGEGANGCC
jgi:small GTP-binding protein